MIEQEHSNTLRNRLLAALPSAEYSLLSEYFSPVTMMQGQVLFEEDDPLTHVYFPTSGVISMLAVMENGQGIEVATVGNEGYVGISPYFGDQSALARALVQVPGSAARMAIQDFSKLMDAQPRFARLIQGYTHALLKQIFRSAGCNSLHSVEKRLARWILMMQDRVGQDKFALTQVFMSDVLGVQRQTMGLAAASLKKAGLIDYRRGIMHVLNRQGLESVSCECYRKVQDELQRLLRRI